MKQISWKIQYKMFFRCDEIPDLDYNAWKEELAV